MSSINVNSIASRIYQQNKKVGWWDDPDRCILQTLQLVSTEVAEATEGDRKDLNDDHLPARKMAEVELADALIRILDVAGRFNIAYNPATAGAVIDPMCEEDTAGAQHLGVNCALVDLARLLSVARTDVVPSTLVNEKFQIVVDSLIFIAERNGYDIFGALEEKLEYNAKRQDHKRENRAKEGGKKY